jgi:hypothetical protein
MLKQQPPDGTKSHLTRFGDTFQIYAYAEKIIAAPKQLCSNQTE